MPQLKKLYKSIKNQALDESLWAVKTKEATNSDTWGPTGTQLNELAKATSFGPETFNEIFNVLYHRLDERETKWRKCHKALLILEFFLLRGDEHCINPVRIGRFAPKLRELQAHFVYQDPNTGRDAGKDIRQRAKDILEMAEDVDMLRERREKAARTRSCVGISSDDTIPRLGSDKSIEETYTAGRKTFSRTPSSKKSLADDWGEGALGLNPGMSPIFTADNYGSDSTRVTTLPKALVESPDLHQVKISKDSRGRIQSIESKTLATPPPPSWGQEEAEEGTYESKSHHPAGAAHESEGSSSSRRLRHVTGSGRKLVAPPSSNISSGKENQSSSDPAIHPLKSSELFDFFDMNASMQQQQQQQQPRKVSNPFTDVDESVVSDPTPLMQLQGTPDGAGMGLAPSVVERGEDEREENTSELFDWTAKIGFDFQKLDLDTSQSPYKVSLPTKSMQGPPMRQPSNHQMWEPFK